MVVDDEKIMRDLLCRSLRPTGCQVIIAEDGLSGLDKLEGNNIDVLISDIRMPKMDGITFVREALKRQPGLAALLVTGYSDTLTRKEAQEMGVADVIIKPFKNVEIIHSLRKALSMTAKLRASAKK